MFGILFAKTFFLVGMMLAITTITSRINKDYETGMEAILTFLGTSETGDVAANNPSFKSLNIKFTLFSDSEIEEAHSETQKEVMRYFNELHKDWFQNICIPALKKISNINIKIFEKKGDENAIVYSQE